jgi:hypothetical protein
MWQFFCLLMCLAAIGCWIGIAWILGYEHGLRRGFQDGWNRRSKYATDNIAAESNDASDPIYGGR